MNQLIDTIFEKLPPLRKNLQGEFFRLFGPQITHPYFCKRPGLPYNFQSDAGSFEMVNAAWMADAALLVYVPNPEDNEKYFDMKSLRKMGWSESFVEEKIKNAGFNSVKFFNRQGTQLFVAHNSKAVVVSFRGTQVQELRDLLYDGKFVASNEGNGKIHGGFRDGLNAVWCSIGGEEGVEDYLSRITQNSSIPVWFTGHSLGAALAIIAAARWNQIQNVQGLYTFGSPGVGNRAFSKVFNRMNAFRIVHNLDVVTTVSQEPNLLHIGGLYLIDGQRKIKEKTTRTIDKEKIFPKLPQFLLRESLKSIRALASPKTVTTLKLPRWLADHSPKFYSNYIREHV